MQKEEVEFIEDLRGDFMEAKLEYIELPYGRKPLRFTKPPKLIDIIEPNYIRPGAELKELLKKALLNPHGTPRLKDIVKPHHRVGIVLSDPTRNVPRQEMLDALLEEINFVKDENITLFVGGGNHPEYDLKLLNLKDEIYRRFKIIYHHSMDDSDMQYAGRTKEGTEVRVNKKFMECDIKVLTGAIKPHYFAGFSGGAKGLLPGVSSFNTIATNHLMKSRPSAKLGITDGNPVREDMEESARLAGVNFILNVAMNHRGEVIGAVAGDVVIAHREGIKWTRKVSEVKVKKKADIVIVSDKPPITMDLYQASKLVAPGGCFLQNGGSVILAAECFDGTGPLNIVNTVIYETGLKNYLPEKHQVYLVSSLDEQTVKETYCKFANSIDSLLTEFKDATVIILPYAGWIVPIN
jgi:nickel-dependent lactate racemase